MAQGENYVKLVDVVITLTFFAGRAPEHSGAAQHPKKKQRRFSPKCLSLSTTQSHRVTAGHQVESVGGLKRTDFHSQQYCVGPRAAETRNKIVRKQQGSEINALAKTVLPYVMNTL